MLGCWVRPWRGEALSGVVVAVSGWYLICRAPGGFEFRVLFADVKARRAEAWASEPEMPINYAGYRLTEKGSGRFLALPEST